MKWNDPATSQKEELIFAINEMRKCRQHVRALQIYFLLSDHNDSHHHIMVTPKGVLTKNAPLFCIVKQAELYKFEVGYKGGRLSERQRRAAINIIFEACAEAQLSGLMERSAFTAEVAKSLVELGGEKQCIQFVKTLILEGAKCRHRIAMECAIKTASESRDTESLELLVDVYKKSGFNLHTIGMLSSNAES